MFFAALLSLSEAEAAMFTRNSRLGQGKWVKIGITDSGIYEIGYEELLRLGFSDPSKVAVFGNGGVALNEQFTDSRGSMLYTDDMQAVPVVHFDGKVVFYGRGVEQIGFHAASGSGNGYFDRTDRNLYTETGYYFLTESDGIPLAMQVVETSDMSVSDATPLNEGMDFMYHEIDESMGVNCTGRRYLGEKFMVMGSHRYAWDYSLPDAVDNRMATMKADIYLDDLVTATMGFGITGGSKNYEVTKTMPKSDNLVRTVDSTPRQILIPSDRGEVYVSLKPFNRTTELTYSHLDYWILSYAKRVPRLEDETQSRILFEKLDAGGSYSLSLNGVNHRIMDVSDPERPVLLSVQQGGEVYFTASSTSMNAVVFDPSRGLKTPVSYEEIANQDLHFQASAQDADMVIITVPEMRAGAEKLADIHRTFDNSAVSVFDVDKIYNEYSSGRPDPMAYRALLKNVYESTGGRLVNALFIGRVASDFKHKAQAGLQNDVIVMYQHGHESPMNDGYNAFDFYANLDAYNHNSVERRKLDIGIGLLPCMSPGEADVYAGKLVKYITDKDFAYRLNHTLHIGGSGDNNIHIMYADSIADYLDAIPGFRYTHTSQCSEIGTPKNIREWLKNGLSGANMAFYFGHATSQVLDGSLNTLPIEDTYTMRNNNCPLMFIGACSVANSDRGTRGIGESLVLSTRHGMMATVSSMRSTYAAPNVAMYKLLPAAIHNMENASGEYTSPWLGKAVAEMKTNTRSLNELTYTLIGDPALRWIVPSARVVPELKDGLLYAGEELVVKGEIRNDAGELLDLFNGEIVAKILAPSDTVRMTPDKADSKTGWHKYKTPQPILGMAAAEVFGGRFEIAVRVPVSAAQYAGRVIDLSFGAYDPTHRYGAGGVVKMISAAGDSFERPGGSMYDDTAPVIDDLRYDASENILLVSASDDVALNLSTLPFAPGIGLRLDGKTITGTESCPKRLDYEFASYTAEIPLPGLADGYHTAVVSVVDEAGNKTEKSLTFLVGRDCSATLRLDGVAAVEEAVIFIEEGISALPSEMEIVIVDSDRKQIARVRTQGKVCRWNLKDQSGNRVPMGLYRAVGLSTDAAHADFMTSELLVPVL